MYHSFFRSEWKFFRCTLRRVPPLALSIFILSVVCMNLLANKELFKTDFLALDCGFAVSWISFLLMDCICKVYGGKAAAEISILGIIVNLVTFGIFHLLSLTPGMWGAYYDTQTPVVNEALNETIGGSTWIVFGSAAAMFVSSITNSVLNMSISKLCKSNTYLTFVTRSTVSTFFSQIVDNLFFAIVVSYTLFGWSVKQIIVCSLTAAVLETISELLFSGYGYRLTKNWTENIEK